MPLHPEAQAFLTLAAAIPPLDTLTLDQIRALEGESIVLTGAPTAMQQVTNTEVAGVPVRVYRPFEASSGVVVYFHGGGWVTGSIEVADTTARDIAAHSGATVVSVAYRKAPDHPFPAAADDAIAVTRALLDGASGLPVDPHAVAVAGDSSGGNLAAVTAQQLARHPVPLRHQALIYPVLDVTMQSPSHQQFAEGYYLTKRDLQFYLNAYAPHADPRDPRLSPGLNTDLDGIAPATIITAEFDPLRDEGETYAAALREAGIPATSVRFLGLVHPFLYFPTIMSDANAARRFIGLQLRAALDVLSAAAPTAAAT